MVQVGTDVVTMMLIHLRSHGARWAYAVGKGKRVA